jgi:serine protease Do
VGIAPPEVSRGLRRAVGLPEVDGLLVRTVEEGGPGERAGLAEGDLIVGTSSRPLADADDLYAALEAASGEELTLRVLRGAEERVVSVPLGGRRDE